MKTIAGLLIIIVCFSCNESTVMDVSKNEDAIFSTDTAFSNLSAKEGMKSAFLQYMDSSAILLRPNHYPIAGNDAVNYLNKIVDTSFKLTWLPSKTVVATSGELGYTYGIYTYRDKDTTYQGTYTSVWKKQADGSWKFVLDTGNSGVSVNK